jgi:uncharacterized iron-regulated membrane protein
MAQITMIIGLIALFVAGFVAWYTLWHRRVESAAFQRVPVRSRWNVHRRCHLPSDAPHR